MKKIFLFFSFLVILSCVGPQVVYDYDTKKDFSNYKTYNYYPNLKTGLSDLDNKRLFFITDSLLKVKEFQLSENPHLYINFKSKQYETPSNNRIGIGVGNGPISVGGSIPIGGTNQHILLTMDFVDVSKDELVWQVEIDGIENPTSIPKDRDAFFYNMIRKALKKYPPKRKK